MAASGKLDLVRGDSHLAGNLLDGSLEGPLRIDEHDRPQASLGYRQGQLHGASTLFHPNGKVSAQLAFVDGKLHGPVSFHAAEGWLQRKAHYRNGLLHGEALNYFANGQVAEREHYRDGVRDGVYQRFHGNGQLAFDGRYLNGQLLDGAQPFADDGRPLDSEGKPMARWRWWWSRLAEP
ncbi:TPA: toxin-antitoxin system YwqK family antitoxin [Pseudomonas aeruginosa]|nr:toxin-antitoxin system YwqK family antitoxin [Pseudomonas aeruginosa]